MTCATTWMNLEDMTQKQIPYGSTQEGLRVVKFRETGSRMVVTKGWGARALGDIVQQVQSFSFAG